MLLIFVRAIILYILVLVVMRFMGKREIGQLQPFELAISIMIADLATIPMTEPGIPITNALRLCAGACNNVVYSQSCQMAAEALENGEQLSEFFARNSFLYDNVFTSMFIVGEESGNIPEVSLCLADMYERDIDSFFNSISSIIEPIMILFVGGVIGFIVISVFMPLYTVFSAF